MNRYRTASSSSGQHLTDDDFARLLAEADRTDDAHLAVCAACRAELDSMRSTILGFRLAATGYAAAHAPARLRSRTVPVRQLWRRPRAAWAAGLVAAMALCTASLSVLHRPVHTPVPHDTRVTAVADSTTDSRLLEDIDEDVSDSVPPSLKPLDVSQTGERSRSPAHN